MQEYCSWTSARRSTPSSQKSSSPNSPSILPIMSVPEQHGHGHAGEWRGESERRRREEDEEEGEREDGEGGEGGRMRRREREGGGGEREGRMRRCERGGGGGERGRGGEREGETLPTVSELATGPHPSPG